MATQKQIQEIANRGIQDQLPPERRAKFDELVKRGIITLPDGAQSTVQAPSAPNDELANSPLQEAGAIAQDAGRALKGVADTALTIGSGIIAEPIAGVAGIAQSLNPFADPGAGARAVKATRDFIQVDPLTEQGKENVEAIGGAIEPVAKVFTDAENTLGDKAFELTGSPTIAAIAKSVPTLGAELLGLVGAKGAIKIGKNRTIAREITEATLTPAELRKGSSAVFKEIDDTGITVDPESFANMVNDVTKKADEFGVDVTVTPASNAALNRLQDAATSGNSLSLGELDTLRKVAKNATKNTNNAADAALGRQMVDSIDDFLGSAGKGDLVGDADAVASVSKKYKIAREMWGRAKRAELLDDAVELAETQASGFENGIRTQFRQIIRNEVKGTTNFFSKAERAQLQKVVDGSAGANLAKILGSFGVTAGQGSNSFLALMGALGGQQVGLPGGALALPIIGTVSKSVATKLTKNNAKFANEVIRAGTDAKKITTAYVNNVAKANRSPRELAQLLIRKDIDLSTITNSDFARNAAKLAQDARQKAGAAAAVAGSQTPDE